MVFKNLGNLAKIGVLILLGITILNAGIAFEPYGSKADVNTTPENTTEVQFSVYTRNSTPIDAELMVKSPFSNWKTYNTSYGNQSFSISKSYNETEIKHYRYKWVFEETSSPNFPSSPLGFTIPSENKTIYNYSVKFTNTLSEKSLNYCNFKKNDFSCAYENIQGQKILLNTEAYRLTSNKTYLNRAFNYSLADYSISGPRTNCNQYADDYNCENDETPDDGINASSGQRQGLLIYSLWNLYSETRNETIKSLAKNYTEGAAKNCPVWSNTTFVFRGTPKDIENASYICGKSKGQGSMMMGYWEAYQVTGNKTYRKKAQKLSTTNFTDNSTSPRIIRGLILGYEATGNKTYLSDAEYVTKKALNDTENLSSSEFFDLGKALFRGYRATGEYGYYRNGLELLDYNTSSLNYSCSAVNKNFSCQLPDTQSKAGLMYIEGFLQKKDFGRKFFNPKTQGMPIVGENLTLDVNMNGKIEQPVLNYRQRGGGWSNCTISFFDGCNLGPDQLTNQTVYEFYFNSSKLRFPRNGSFNLGVSIQDDNRIETARKFSNTDNERTEYCAIWQGDYSCEEESYQSSMMNAMTTSYRNTYYNNYSQKLSRLVSPPYYRDVLQAGFSCRPEKNDFVCNTSSIQETLTGSARQGSLISSLFSAYSATGNIEAYRLGEKYVRHSPSDCNVWRNDFHCNSSVGQGAMINGYWDAYKITSNDSYRRVALNLSRESLNMTGSRRLASAQWRTFSLTNKNNYSASAQNITKMFNQTCNDRNCTPEQYYKTANMFENAYLYGSGSYLDDYRFILTGTTTETGCGPGKQDFTCSNPGVQGSISDLFRTASRIVPVQLKSDESFDLSDSINVGQSTEAKCKVTNRLPNTTLENVQFSLELSTGLNTSSNLTQSTGNLNYTNSSSASWSVDANEVGDQEAACKITSSNGLAEVLEKSVSVVNSRSNDDSDSGEESSEGTTGGGLGSIRETKNYSIAYNENNRRYELNETFLNKLNINTSLRRFNLADKGCYTAERRVLENSTTLSLDYSCSADGILIFDDTENGVRVHRVGDLSREFSITYGFSSNLSSPMVVEYEDIPPLEMDVNYRLLNRTGSALKVGINLNRESNCNVRKGREMIFNGTIAGQEYVPIDKAYGKSQIDVNCGGLNSSYTFVSDTRLERFTGQETENMFVMVIVALGFILSGSAVFYYRSIFYRVVGKFSLFTIALSNQIDGYIGSILFQFHLRKFREQVSENNEVEAIQTFEKLSDYGDRQASEDLLNMNIDLMRGVRLYILMELVEEGLEDGVKIPYTGDDIEELVSRYLEEVDNPELESLIKDKITEITALK